LVSFWFRFGFVLVSFGSFQFRLVRFGFVFVSFDFTVFVPQFLVDLHTYTATHPVNAEERSSGVEYL
jgi:hypothetical protein